ncbi:hypothetical protein BVY04_01555 [bacterium M21]|nr:hypothetical protein BVY04_01555 [bacterium M21]
MQIPCTIPQTSACERGALELIVALRKHGYEAYTVGGGIRDRLVGRTPKDADITTNALPEEVLKLFPHTIPVGQAFGVIIVVHEGINYEIATFREDADYTDGRRPGSVTFSTAEEDAKRRDFTINALFYDPIEEILIDVVDGLTDLRKGHIRAIGVPGERFSEDYLRMLRAVRFTAELGFTLDPATATAIRAQAASVSGVSGERIHAEVTKMLIGRNPRYAFELMHELGLLQYVLPEIETMIGVEQPKQYHPEGDVWIHTMMMLDRIRMRGPELAWAVLLHDVGKPGTFELSDEGVERFPCHARLGADMTKDILKRLKCSNSFIEDVSTAVYNHMSFADVQKMRKSTLRRLLGRGTFALELELHRIDCMASHGSIDNYAFLLDKLDELKHEPILPPPLLSGKDLMELGMKPGPRFGVLLRQIEELHLEGVIADKDAAIGWIKEQPTDNG